MPIDADAGSAMVNTSQQIGGAVGAAALSAVFTNAVTDYLSNHHPTSPQQAPALQGAAAIHGYSAAFTVAACIFRAGAIIVPLLLRSRQVAAAEAPQSPSDVRAMPTKRGVSGRLPNGRQV